MSKKIVIDKDILEIIPLATVVVDDESKIYFYNNLFKECTHSFFDLGNLFDSAFVKKIGYLYVDPIFDWKHDVMEFYETNKVLLQLAKVQKEFVVHVTRLEMNSLYVVCLSESRLYD